VLCTKFRGVLHWSGAQAVDKLLKRLRALPQTTEFEPFTHWHPQFRDYCNFGASDKVYRERCCYVDASVSHPKEEPDVIDVNAKHAVSRFQLRLRSGCDCLMLSSVSESCKSNTAQTESKPAYRVYLTDKDDPPPQQASADNGAGASSVATSTVNKQTAFVTVTCRRRRQAHYADSTKNKQRKRPRKISAEEPESICADFKCYKNVETRRCLE